MSEIAICVLNYFEKFSHFTKQLGKWVTLLLFSLRTKLQFGALNENFQTQNSKPSILTCQWGRKNISLMMAQSSPVNNTYSGPAPLEECYISAMIMFSHISCVCELLKSKPFPQLIVFANYLWKSNYLQPIQLLGKALLIGKDGGRLCGCCFQKNLPKYCTWCITLDTSDWVASAVLHCISSPR